MRFAEIRSTPDATRTRDLLLRRQLLYPLSYRGFNWVLGPLKGYRASKTLLALGLA
jgi:hypothetical protein